ncbi:MAG: DUF302 domain-containing protein [Sulfuricurvum sp.]
MKKIAFYLWMILGVVALHAQGDLHEFSCPNPDGKVTPTMIEKGLEANGFVIAGNSEMTHPFQIQFGESDFSAFNLLTVYHAKHSAALVKNHADGGIFVPMSLGIYQRKGDKNLHVAVLTSQGQEKIAGFKAPEFGAIEKLMVATLTKVLPQMTHTITKTSLPAQGKLVTRFVHSTEGQAWKKEKENVEMMIEDGLKPAGFTLSNFTDYQFVLTDKGGTSPFDFYDTYSICKLKVIYTVAKTHPEASAFAPCTLMVYKKKDANEIVMGFPSVYSWLSAAQVNDAEGKAVLLQAQKDFEAVLQGASE